MKNIRITPHWQLSSSISLSYLPALEEREEDQQDDPQEDVDLKTCTVSMALSYTPNPSLVRYPSLGHNKSSRVDIGWLSSFKKFENQPDQQEHTDDKGEYYYIGSIYGQWSLQLCNSHALTLATEWIHDGVAEQALKNKIKTSPLKISLLGDHEFRWGGPPLGAADRSVSDE